MPLLFSPIDQNELINAYTPRPRGAFLMLRLGEGASSAEIEMTEAVREVLKNLNFLPVTASDVRGTADYLTKIVDLIRGCGFGIAIYDNHTPARTMGNIFFEVGVCGVLGKPVQLLLSGDRVTPSDFVRTEWIEYRAGREADLRRDLHASLSRIDELGAYYNKLGLIGLDAPQADLELAFERFKQAVLISDDAEARGKILEIQDRLQQIASKRRSSTRDDMASHRDRLLKAIREFLTLLPPQS